MRQRTQSEIRKSPIAMALAGIGFILLAGALAAITWRIVEPPGAEFAAASDGRCATAVAVNTPAPELELIDLDSQSVSLEMLKGNVLLVNTWATWCPPCRAEMPILEQYYQAHREQGFILIGIDIAESRSVVQQFVDAQELSFPVWLDAHEASLRAFRSISLPSSFVLDRQGVIRLAWQGATCLTQLEADVTPLIHE